MTRWTRRRFLAATGLTGVAAIPAVLGSGAVGDALWPTPAGERLASLFTDTTSARRIGVAYVRSHPDETPDRLLAGVSGLQGRGESLRRAVVAASRADFAAGRVVRVEGWVLSLTEARVCAIVASTT